jgi:hypothetical protein
MEIKAKVSAALCAAFFALTSAPLATAAAEQERCSELVKECFAYSNTERESCFRAVASHSFCHDARAGDLATKRSQFSSSTPPEDDGPSFIGQQLVDRPCVENFDNSWSGALVKGVISDEQYATLEKSLRECSKAPSSDLLRP